MIIDDCFELGHVVKPHGLQGELDVILDSDNPEAYSNLESVLVFQSKKLVPFFIQFLQIHGNKARIKFVEVNAIEEAAKLRGAALYLPLSTLPPLKGTRFYFHEVIGFEVNSDAIGVIGTIKQVYPNPNQSLLGVDRQGVEVLIPINEWTIQKVDRDQKQLWVQIPEGLLEIYLNQ